MPPVQIWGNVGGVTGYLPMSALVGLTGQLLGMNAGATLAEWKAGTFLANQFAGPVGSQFVPLYSFTGDLNTGIFQDGADAIGITAGGFKRVSFGTTVATFSTNIQLAGKLLLEAKGADIAAAATTDLGNATGNFLAITNAAGATNISSLGGATLISGAEIETLITITGGSITLIHDPVALILLGGANVALQSGDVIRWRKINSASAFWQMVSIARGINVGVLTTAGDLLVGLGAGASGRLGVGADGSILVATSDPAEKMAWLMALSGMNLINGYLDWTVAGNILTVALKTMAGQDPSPAAPVYLTKRNNTAGTAIPNVQKITAAASTSISIGSIMGTRNGVPFRLWAVAYPSGAAGVAEIALINCSLTTAGVGSGNDVSAWYPLQGFMSLAITAEGGAGAADSAGVFYGPTTRANRGSAVIGYATWEAGLAVAGNWSAAPTRINPWQAGTALPGDELQAVNTIDATQRNLLNVVTPQDNTIPQIGEGNPIATLDTTITPNSAANILEIEFQPCLSKDATNTLITVHLHQDAVANALRAWANFFGAITAVFPLTFKHSILAGSVVATTFKLRAGGGVAAVLYLNSDGGGAALYGGVFGSRARVTERMG